MRNLVIAVLTLALVHAAHAGPTHSRNKREIYPEIEPEKAEDIQPQVCVVGDLVYGAEEPVPADQPCLKCKCQPPGVHCEATRCQKKPGCRPIHKPNTCCPDYQCECEYEGRTYANGERLEQKPGTECKVCYCRGGEVQCAEVSCYMRNDCEGRKVPGKCCPKYDHCPPREPLFDRSLYPTELVNTIKEVSQENEINETTPAIDLQLETVKVDKAVQTDNVDTQKITIQEIIPEIKEFPITNSPKREINENHQGQLLVEEAVRTDKTEALTSESNELEIPDADSDSSEVAEIYQQPPPVLRIGDKLLFLKKGELIPEKDASTPSTIITIIGAEGLQRGFEDSVESTKFDAENKTADEEENEEEFQAESSDQYLVHKAATEETSPEITTETKKDIEMVTETNLEVNNVTDFEVFNSTSFEDRNPVNETLDLGEVESLNAGENVTEIVVSSSTVEVFTSSVSPKSTTEKEEVDVNPEYPPIPDVMSPQNADAQLDGIEAKILPEVLEIRSNKTVPENMTNPEWLKRTLINVNAALPENILKTVADSDIVEEAEDVESTTMSRIQSKALDENFGSVINNSEFSKNNIKSLAQESYEDAISGLRSKEDPYKSVESLESSTVEETSVTSSSVEKAAVISNEDASVEGLKDFNLSDLVETLPGFENSTDGSVEVLTTTTENSRKRDVEMIDASLFNGSQANVTHEDGVEVQAKLIEKRQNTEDDKIFAELDHEIGLASGDVKESKTKAEEEKEAKSIFDELLAETESNTTPKPLSLQPKDRETAVLQRVSDAIAKFQLRDTKQSLDSNILGILRDFFSSQYKSHNRK